MSRFGIPFALALLVACGRSGFDPIDGDGGGGGDGGTDDDSGDTDLDYVTLGPGWSVDVFVDFSADYTFVDADFVDGTDTYNNLATSMFSTSAPYPQTLVVIAGRDLYELTATGAIRHAFGDHPPNTLDLPDFISSGVWSSNINGGSPGVLLSSSSELDGDGTFAVSTAWVTTMDRSANNTRAVVWDETGAVDSRATPEGYLGTQNGVVRRSDTTQIFSGDNKTMTILSDGRILLARTITIDVEVELHLVAPTGTGSYPSTLLYQAAQIEVGEGTAQAPAIGWALVDEKQLVRAGATALLDTVASSGDPDARWQASVSPPPGHPLTTVPDIVYVLETNRVLDRDRVLVFTPP